MSNDDLPADPQDEPRSDDPSVSKFEGGDGSMTPAEFARQVMVDQQIAARGIEDSAVLDAMRAVPRDAFVAPDAVAFAYEDRALPIAEGQTISQPYIVALMTEAARVGPGDRVLEVGTGSGYQAAVLSHIAERVYSVERHPSLAHDAARRFRQLGYDTIRVRVDDGTLGWPDEAPFDAILVTAGGPEQVPSALLDQLAPGGRLVIPVGDSIESQELIRIRRSDDGRSFERDELGKVQFVPLVGRAGWSEPTHEARVGRPERNRLSVDMGRAALPFDDLDTADLSPFLDRIGGSRIVLIGEASHGTSEFYRFRARLTRDLIERRGFDFVAIEGDWPDVAEVDAWVRHHSSWRTGHPPFQRFPTWMWANHEVFDFLHWLREYNDSFRSAEPHRVAGVHGLDLYSMYASMDWVVRFLEDCDPEAAAEAKQRYACLSPWQDDPIVYGRRVTSEGMRSCEDQVVSVLQTVLRQRLEETGPAALLSREVIGDRCALDGGRAPYLHAVQNARVVRSAEAYYREMYRGSIHSWNLRDRHMYDTLGMLLSSYGPESRGVVWAHNSHVGDARATAMGQRGEHNLGQLVRTAFGRQAYLVGFGTNSGRVAAASDWNGPMEIKTVHPAHPASYEHVAHLTGIESFALPLRDSLHTHLIRTLNEWRLQRAIGVIYRPDRELQSHYLRASLPRQFDEWIWFDETDAVRPITLRDREAWLLDGVPDTFPFGV